MMALPQLSTSQTRVIHIYVCTVGTVLSSINMKSVFRKTLKIQVFICSVVPGADVKTALQSSKNNLKNCCF
jgi:hypothetical protein